MNSLLGNRALNEWYMCFGMILRNDLGEGKEHCGVSWKRNEWPVIFNITQKQCHAKLTFYFEDAPPMEAMETINPQQSHVVPPRLNKTYSFVPEGKPFGMSVKSDGPVIVQFSASALGPNVEPTRVFPACAVSRIAYPGPLGKKETRWVHPDGFSVNQGDKRDVDRFVFLNPDPSETAHVTAHVCQHGKILRKELSVRPQSIAIFVPGRELPIAEGATYGTILQSTVPVVVEVLRTYSHADSYAPIYEWLCRSYPIGDVEIDDFIIPKTIG